MSIQAEQQVEGFVNTYGWKAKECEHQLASFGPFGIGNMTQKWILMITSYHILETTIIDITDTNKEY